MRRSLACSKKARSFPTKFRCLRCFSIPCFIWSLTEDRRLGPAARELVADRTNDISVSSLALWEIALKRGADRMPLSVGQAIEAIAAFGYRLLHLLPAHIQGFSGMPHRPDHRDPFDRMLIAQARHEGLTLMTSDAKLTTYGVPTIDCA